MNGVKKMPRNIGYLTAGRTKESDEVYTPEYAIKPLLQYLKPRSTIWCPFDSHHSNYVKVFKKHGFKVINTHLDNGEDFLQQCQKKK